MKGKVIKKLTALSIGIIIVMTTMMPAFAASQKIVAKPIGYEKTCVGSDSGTRYTNDTEYITVNGNTAFCIQAGYDIAGLGPGGGTGYVNYAVSQINTANSKQNKIAYLGWYNTSSKSNRDYAFTQMYIWKSLADYPHSGNANITYTSAANNSAWATWKAGIDTKINTWNTYPSFDYIEYGTVTNITAGESITLTDANGVLEDYLSFTHSKDGLTVSHKAKSNSMTVSAAKDCTKDTITMLSKDLSATNCQKYDSKAVGSYVYTNADSQDLATYGFVDPIYMDLSFDVALKSNIALVKTSEDGAVVGLKFNIRSADGAFDQDFVTDDNGKINVEMIDPGEYIVTELETPDKYVQPESQTITLVGGETTSVTFDNVIKRGSFELTKTDFISGELLENAKFEIRNEAGDVVYEGVTGEDGKWVTEEIPYGKYTYQETAPPVGFLLDSKVYEFEILEDGQVVKVDIPNMPKVGTWQLYPPDGIERGHIISAPVTGDTQPDIAGYLLVAEIAMLIGCALVIAKKARQEKD